MADKPRPPDEAENAPTQQRTASNSNRSLFSYLAASEPYATEYQTIMDVSTGTLLADLSASQIAAALTDAGVPMDLETAEERCGSLVKWGNLVRSVRDTRVSSIAAYQRSRSRYQASKLGGRVHRDALAILAASDGAREVARELLGRIAESLVEINAAAGLLHRGQVDRDHLASRVTGVFGDHRIFTESITDFYAYLSGVLTRYDLTGGEYAQFKDLLLGYVDVITDDVNHNAPLILTRLSTVSPFLDDIIAALPAGLDGKDLFTVERLPGRTRLDWEQLAAWYGAGDSRSGPDQLRDAAGQALRQLLTNARRILAPSGTGVTRRADFLKLAGWFHDADADTATRLFDATFGAWPSRHLALGPEPDVPAGRVTDSWWDSDPVDVPVTMRERGDLTARGRASRTPDTAAAAAALLAAETAKAGLRAAAAAELGAAGKLDGARLSRRARDMLLEQLALLLTPQHIEPGGSATRFDSELTLTLTARPTRGAATTVHSNDGTLTVNGYELTCRAANVDTGFDSSTVSA